MACCFSGESIEGDPRACRSSTFVVPMKDAPTAEPGVCIYGCCCIPCAAFSIRRDVLDGDFSRYVCCQGYFCPPNTCTETSCPQLCLCCEAFLCPGPSMSGTRLYLMDMYQLQPDPCDNQIIRLNNCLVCLSCICDRNCTQCISQCVFVSTFGCMAAQAVAELRAHVNVSIQSPIPMVDEQQVHMCVQQTIKPSEPTAATTAAANPWRGATSRASPPRQPQQYQ